MRGLGYAQAELERLLANLIRIGVVSALDEAAARVTVDVGGMSTDWLPWLTAAAGNDSDWWAPEEGEQVLVLSPFGDPAQAVVLRSIYSDHKPAPANKRTVRRVVFGDGTLIEYDREAHRLTANVGPGSVLVVAGDVRIQCDTATVEASGSVTLDTPQTTCTGALTVQGRLSYLAGMSGRGGDGDAGQAAEIVGSVRVVQGNVIADGIGLKTHVHGNSGPPSG